MQDAHQILSCGDFSRVNPTGRGNAAVFVVAQVGNQHLKRRFGVHYRARNIIQNAFKKHMQIVVQFRAEPGFSIQTVRVNHRKIRQFVACPQLNKQIKGRVQCPINIRVLTIEFVNHNDSAQIFGDGLFEHKAGLRFWSFHGIHQQQHAIHHIHNAFHFAAKIGVSGCVYNVDFHQFTGFWVWDAYRRIFCQDGYPAFALQVI